MRENRTYGSEGGEAQAFPTPINVSAETLLVAFQSWQHGAMTKLFELAVAEVRKLPSEDQILRVDDSRLRLVARLALDGVESPAPGW